MKTRYLVIIAGLAPLLWLSGCRERPTSTRFQMPAGNVEQGKAAFVALECYECHRVAGVDLPAPTVDVTKIVTLGGEVTRMRTYGDLITSIVHPAQNLSDLMRVPLPEGVATTPMPVVNDRMTVAQLIDLVTFLQPHYKELEPLYQPNPIYGP